MRFRNLFILWVTAVVATSAAEAEPEKIWEKAVVRIEVTSRQYDYLQPWARRVGQVQKMGTIVGEREILTAADHLLHQTLIRLQKGRGRWYRGELVWVDYHANLALVTCADDGFWEETEKVELAKVIPRQGTAQLVRWREGRLESRNVELNRVTVKKGKLTFIDLPFLEVDSEIQGIGWSEAIVQGKKLIGITSSKEEHSITVIPSFFIRSCLEDREESPYKGLGYFSFVWQSAENPETLQYLGLKGEPRGVVVVQVSATKDASPLRPRDIILEIDGFAIDVQGDYRDPDYGDLLLEALATRSKRAGEGVKMKVFRGGEEIELTYILPKAEYSVEVVPQQTPETEPEYLLLGGLLFQPLTQPYLGSWGPDWKRKAPFRLIYATREEPQPDRPSYVVLTLVLPDPYNLGYQDARYLLVERVNGRKVATLNDLVEALRQPNEGFHLLEFIEGDTLRRMVLDATELEAATARVLERYGIQRDRYISAPSSTGLRLTAD